MKRRTPPPDPETVPPPQARRGPAWACRLARWSAGLVGSLLWLLGLGFALLAAGLLAFVLWASTPVALPQTLKWAQEWLTDADSGTSPLSFHDARGSLTHGGRIERLQWQQDGLTIEIDSLAFAWEPSLWLGMLLERKLTTGPWVARRIHVRDERPAQPPDDSLQPPERLTLPWFRTVSLPVQVDALAYAGPTTLESGRLVAHYRYDTDNAAPSHRLQVDELAWADGRYLIEASLLAVQPLTLQVDLEASIDTPGAADVPSQTLAVRAAIHGHLGGEDALLQAEADVRPASATRGKDWNPVLRLQARLRPWADMPLDHADLHLQDINIAQFWPQGPSTRLDGDWHAAHLEPAASGAWRWRLQGRLHNRSARPWNEGGLPLDRLETDLELQPDRGQVHALRWALGASRLEGQGQARWRPASSGQPWTEQLSEAQGRIAIQGLDPQALWSTLPSARIHAQALAHHASGSTRWSLNLTPQPGAQAHAAPLPTVQAAGVWSGHRVQIDHLLARWLDSRLQARATILLGPSLSAQGQGQWEAPGMELQGSGAWPWAGQPLQANIDVSDAQRFQQWSQRAVQALDAWVATWQLTARTEELWQSRWQGQARLDLSATGAADHSPWPAQWRLLANVPRLTVEGTSGNGTGIPSVALNQTRFDLEGQAQRWSATLEGSATLGLPPEAWTLKTSMRLSGEGLTGPSHRLRWESASLETWRQGAPLGARLTLVQPLDINVTADGHVMAATGAFSLLPLMAPTSRPTLPMAEQPARIEWSRLQWARGRIETQGRAGPMALSWVDAWLSDATQPEGPLASAGFTGELFFEGDWDLSLPLTADTLEPARAQVRWRHIGGDLTYLSGSGADIQRTPVGMESLQADASLQGSDLLVQSQLQTRRFGRVHGQLTTRLAPPAPSGEGWGWPEDAPVQGQLQARLTQLAPFSAFAPPGWRIEGEGQVDARILGTRAQPDWQGQIELRQLAVRSVLDGIEFSDGQLLARLNGEQMTIERLQLRGADGTDGGLLTGEGRASWKRTLDGTPRPEMTLSLQAQRLRLLARADRRLTLSGRIDSRLADGLLDLTGRLDVDQALFLLPDETTPSLGRDVVIRGGTIPVPLSARLPFRLRLRSEVYLGDRFEVRGLGLQTALQGRLLVEARPGQLTPILTGEVRAVRGNYRAYGQRLQIEQGLIRFNGPYDNPSLDILALRPHPTQKVGVEISGTAQSPRVRLYADPDLPDNEKLAWLVLGRPASGAGAEAALLQQAALALLSGGNNDGPLAKRFGLDDLSFQGESVNPDGTTTAAALTLGKRLSEQLYVSYSRSVVGAIGTVAVFLDLSRYLTLRAQAGDDNAIDLIFTHTFDGRGAPRTIPGASP